MKIYNTLRHTDPDIIRRAVKIAAGSTLAILIAERLSLTFSSSAGIITLLTIQNTRQATIRLAGIRFISFIFSTSLAFLLKQFFPSALAGFCILLLLMCCFSYIRKWDLTVSVNAVFATHVLLTENTLTSAFALNEMLLLIIGTSIALLFNWYMPDKEKELNRNIRNIERNMGNLLHSMSLHLMQFSHLTIDKRHIYELISEIDSTLCKAYANKENTLQSHSSYYIEYLMMRKAQCSELVHFYREITSLGEDELSRMPDQAKLIASFLNSSVRELSMTSGTEESMKRIHAVVHTLDSYPLPSSKDEIRSRFILYHLMTGMAELTKLKQAFADSLTEEQRQIYLKQAV